MLKYLCFCSVLFLNLHIKGQRPDATAALNLTTTLSSEAYKARLPVYTMAGAINLHSNSGATYKFGEGVAANTYAQYNQPPALEYFRHSYGHRSRTSLSRYRAGVALTTIGGAGVIAGTVCCIVGFSTPGNVRTTRYANGGQVTVSGLPAIGIVVNVISVPLLIAGAVLLAKNINYARR